MVQKEITCATPRRSSRQRQPWPRSSVSSACGSSNDNGANKGDADKAELVFWGWDSGNSMKEILADFEKANPGITVKFNNTGTAEKTSTALSNAIAAGNGAPDVVMLEDPTVTQFAVTDGLVDLSEFGADKLADDFAAGPWNKLQYNNKPYALPIDSGPEMFFYNKAVFDKAGVDGESIKTGTTTTRPPRRSVPPAPTSPIWPVPPTTISRSPPRSGRPVPSRGRSMARTSPST